MSYELRLSELDIGTFPNTGFYLEHWKVIKKLTYLFWNDSFLSRTGQDSKQFSYQSQTKRLIVS